MESWYLCIIKKKKQSETLYSLFSYGEIAKTEQKNSMVVLSVQNLFFFHFVSFLLFPILKLNKINSFMNKKKY